MKYHLSLYLFFIFQILPANTSAQEDNFSQLRDSLQNIIDTSQSKDKLNAYMQLQDLYYDLPVGESTVRELLCLSDALDTEARQQNEPEERAYNMINTIVYLRNGGQWNEVYTRAPLYLEFLKETKQWDIYYSMQSGLLEAYLYNNQIETTIRKAHQLYEQSIEQKQDLGAGIALVTIGRAYREQRRYDEAIKQFEQGLALLEKQEKITPILLENYWTYCGLFIEDKDYEKALASTQRFDQAFQRYQKQIKREIPSYRAVVLRLYAHAYAGLEQLEKSEACLDEADQLSSDIIGRTNSAMIRAEISLTRADYPRALELMDEAQQLHNPKRDNIELGILRTKADIYARLNRPDENIAANKAAFALSDTLSFHTFNDQIEEFRTLYEVDTHIAARERQRHYFLFALGACLLLALTLGIYIRYNRIILRKNRSLYHRIKVQDRMADELQQLQNRYDSFAAPLVSDVAQETPVPGSIPVATPAQRELFTRLREYLLTDRCFANSDIDRNELFIHLSTNRTTLSEAVKVVTGKTLMEYVRSIQLEEAKKLLETQPVLTIEAIAGECGFNTPRTFYRNFREQYNISPAEYRKLSQE